LSARSIHMQKKTNKRILTNQNKMGFFFGPKKNTEKTTTKKTWMKFTVNVDMSNK